jgi:hypothetical protein
MKEILDKIGVYNLFNFLLPGVLFAVTLEYLTSYSIAQENLVIGAFIYYFAGLVISRFGSLVIEPFLKKILFLKFSPYTDFVSATKNDPKIELLSQDNNMYRTFVALFVLLILVKVYELVADKFPVLNEQIVTITVVVLLIGFLLSYRKQSTYVSKRIESNKG